MNERKSESSVNKHTYLLVKEEAAGKGFYNKEVKDTSIKALDSLDSTKMSYSVFLLLLKMEVFVCVCV